MIPDKQLARGNQIHSQRTFFYSFQTERIWKSDRSDRFPFDYELNGIPFGSQSKGKLYTTYTFTVYSCWSLCTELCCRKLFVNIIIPFIQSKTSNTLLIFFTFFSFQDRSCRKASRSGRTGSLIYIINRTGSKVPIKMYLIFFRMCKRF